MLEGCRMRSQTRSSSALIASKARLADFLLLSKNLPSPRSPQRYASATSAPSSVFAGPPRGTSAPRSSSTATFAGPAGGNLSAPSRPASARAHSRAASSEPCSAASASRYPSEPTCMLLVFPDSSR